MKRVIRFHIAFVFLFIVTIYSGCDDNQKEDLFLKSEDCSFQKIRWASIGENVEIRRDFNLELELELRAYLQKIGIGKLDAKPDFIIDYQKFEEKKISFDKDYVMRYNTLVDGICGTWGILKDKDISPELKIKMENIFEKKVENFYHFIFKENRNEKIVDNLEKSFPNCHFDLSTPQYIVCVFATSDVARAVNIVSLFKEKGYKSAGKFWLPNCPATGSTKLYQIYADKVPTLDQALETMCIIANKNEFHEDYQNPFVLEIVNAPNPIKVYYSQYDCEKKERK